MIQVNNLSKTYNGTTVLKIDSLEIKKGESFGLVGNNGAGKTTFFSLLLDLIQPKQQAYMNNIVQQAYQKWLKAQSTEVKQHAPQKLYWGQADWFFDQEGIGLHYRTHEIAKDGAQLDIYFNKQQTQQILKVDAYQNMF